MKIYDTPLAPNPRRVRWFMAEKGIEDVEVIQLNLLKGEHNIEAGTRALKLLDRRLGESEWLAGDRLTIADIIAFVGIDFGRMIKFRPPEELTHVCRWAAVMRERPAAKAGMPQRPPSP